MLNQNRTLLVLKYIWEHSDEEHQVTAKDILLCYYRIVGKLGAKVF